MTGEAPKSPAEPRNGEPYYIDARCPACSTNLVLYDSLTPDQFNDSAELGVPTTDSDDKIWHDEWVCPRCLDGVHLDIPRDVLEELSE